MDSKERVRLAVAGKGRLQSCWIAVGLIALTVVTYIHAGRLDFVNFDDGRYVYLNDHVKAGLTWNSIVWAFKAFVLGLWHPLTLLSYMLDVQLFGVNPHALHLVNVAIHTFNTLLLFLLLKSATGRPLRSAMVAALFAVHPLHVESVAWIAERKDVLSTFFWLLALNAWVRYARFPSTRQYIVVAMIFVLGLMSKPMVMTLPVTLLLMDFWPLCRVNPAGLSMTSLRTILLEKVPLLFLSIASVLITLLSQDRSGAVGNLQVISISERIGNAVLAAGLYLMKMIWPVDLSVLYPHPALTPQGMPWAAVSASAILLMFITALVIWQWRPRPYLAIGWAWYLVTVLPVIGLVQVGLQGMADRYTYVPLIGPFFALVWLVADLLSQQIPRIWIAGVSVILLLGMSFVSFRQVGVWQNSFTLFEHALAITPDNAPALRNLGTAWQDAQRPDKAIPLLEESVRLLPLEAHTWMNLGISYMTVGRVEEAQASFEKAARMRPNDGYILYNLALAFAMQQRWEEAQKTKERLASVSPELAIKLEALLNRVQNDR
ncbi:MAG: tetratricopeptide repeat protein [Nitrospirae bacterium]|nr:tetratricopeptide repeat protein [Nitrospirota bacterium]